MNHQDPEYLNRLLKQLNPDVLRAAEATMLKGDIANLQRQCDLSVAAVIEGYKTSIAPLVERLAELERVHAGEQTSLFGASLRRGMEEGHELVKDSPFNAAMNYAAKYPASQKPIGPVIPCSNENPPIWGRVVYGGADLLRRPDEPASDSKVFVGIEGAKAAVDAGHITQEAYQKAVEVFAQGDYHTPKNAQVVTENGQTFFVFKSAGYKAIAERLGFPYRPVVGGFREYMLTPREYNDVFVDHERAAKYRKEMKNFTL